MTNPHIIVGEPRRCICGNYGTHEKPNIITCGDLLQRLKALEEIKLPPELLSEIVGQLVVDCGSGV